MILAAWVVVTATIVAVWYLYPTSPSSGGMWSVAEPGGPLAGSVSGGSYYLVSSADQPVGGLCSGNDGQNFSVTKLNWSTGATVWRSEPVPVPCTYYQGFPQQVAVLPDRVVMAVTMNGLDQGGGSRLILTAFNPSTGAEISNATFSQSGPQGLDPETGDWPVAGGALITWSVANATQYNITAYSLESLSAAWNATVRVPAAGDATLESADFINEGPGGIAAGNESCLTTDPETFPLGDFHSSNFRFRNASIACLADQDGRLLWQRNLTGTGAPALGTASPTAFYYLDNTSGVLRVQGLDLANGSTVADFPVQGLSRAPLATVSVGWVASEITVTTTGPFPYDNEANPLVAWGDFQAYTPTGTRLWNDTIPEDVHGVSSGANYFVEPPMPLSGDRLLLGDYLGWTYDATPGASYTQAFEVVNATTGSVLEQRNIDIVKEQSGQFNGAWIGSWLPVTTVGSVLLYVSEGDLAASSF